MFRDVSQIGPGRQWRADIERAVERASAMVVVIGPQWTGAGGQSRILRDDDVVRNEVASALRSGRPTFPVLVRGARLSASSELPHDVKNLLALNAIALTDERWRYDVARLIDGLMQVGIVPAVSEPLSPPTGESRLERRATWMSYDPRDTVCARLSTALAEKGIRHTAWTNGVAALEGGSRMRAQMLGGFFVKGHHLPSTGIVRVIDGPKSRVEIVLQENLRGAFTGMDNIYARWFENCLCDFQRASGGG